MIKRCITSLAGLGLAVGLCSLGANGQSINIDFNAAAGVGGGVPPTTHGAAAAQPGTWNGLSGAVGPQTLVGLNGAPISASVTSSTALLLFQSSINLVGATPEQVMLMGDILDVGPAEPPPPASVTHTINNIDNGAYDVFVYAMAPDSGTFRSSVSVNGAPAQTVGGSFSGAYALGITHSLHTVTVSNNTLTILTTATVGFGSLAGIQVRQGNPCLAPLPDCEQDINGNGSVEVNDLLAVIGTWGQNGNPNGPRPQGDVAPPPNGNCIVDVNDLLAVIGRWGPCPVPSGACCLADGTCLANQTEEQCAQANGAYQGDNVTCDSVTCPVVPPNDECGGATQVFNGVNNVDNTNATNSTTPPPPTCPFGGAVNFTRDVWFFYVATCDGAIVVDTCDTLGNVTDTVLAVYTSPCASASLLNCDDDGCGGDADPDLLSQSDPIPVTAGQTLLIRVGSWANDPINEGAIALRVACQDNDLCSNATPVTVGGFVDDTLVGSTGDTVPACATIPVGNAGRWHTVVGNGNTLTASLCGSPDNIKDPYNAVLSVFCGTCSNLFCVAQSDNNNCTTNPNLVFSEQVSFCSAVGQTYFILVSADNAPTAVGYRLNVNNGPACTNPVQCGLPGDECANGIPVVLGNNNIDNTGATTSSGIPGSACIFGGPANVTRDIWCNFTPTFNGPLIVETCATTGVVTDTTLSVLTGPCNALTEIGCDDDACAPLRSRTTVQVTNGTMIRIRVGSWQTSPAGPIVLTLSQPAPPCVLTCPPGGIPEGEPCLTDNATDTTNTGCNATPGLFGTVSLGQTICGISSTYLFNGGQRRDVDAWVLTTTTTATVTLRCRSELSLNFVIFNWDGSCPLGTLVVAGVAQGNCNEFTVTTPAPLAPGTYVVLTSPTVFTGFPCGGANDYQLTVQSP